MSPDGNSTQFQQPLKLIRRRHCRVPRLVALLLAGGGSVVAAQQPCPPEVGSLVQSAWRAYRRDSVSIAEERFALADTKCPSNLDAKTGLGYTALRRGSLTRADSLFQLVISADPANADGWGGLALAANRRGDGTTAVNAARRAIRLNPNDSASRGILDRLSPGWDRPALPSVDRPTSVRLVARTHGSRFEVAVGRRWVTFYIKGINLGAALPGKFPSEFPTDSSLYARWIGLMAGMNANTVRLYTILPPEFYRALRGWNLAHPSHALWLIHGVWTELPPEHDFENNEWKASFREEIRRVVDLLHGAAEIPVRPGHASGRYDADVSRWTLAYIVGREWEPYSVKAFTQAHPGSSIYRGRFLETDPAPVLDRWMAEQCDYLLAYEVDRFNSIRPIAYTNWPTLDPLTHTTEATTDEESAWRRRRGKPANLTREYENDVIGLDASLIRPTHANPAGWFASYHAYPYYPDFMLNDPGYNRARSSEGRSNYFGYLRGLKRHHRSIPLVIAEYGVPSSRGIAHLQPQGWNHGGHDEREMGRIDARLTREIRESGAAGGILFAWIDEWFKKNWVVADFEIPPDNTRRWHNAMDAEQNYGMLGMAAGDTTTPKLGGRPESWLAGERLYAGASAPLAPQALYITSDESYIYLAVPFSHQFPWDSAGIMLALDTFEPLTGQHRLPGGLAASDAGFEFLIELRRPGDGEIRILPEYNPYGLPDSSRDDGGKFHHRPITIRNRDDGVFDSMYVGTNRARYGRDGTFFPAAGYNRGRLRFGADSASTLSDWYYDERRGLLELRLPWALLNVSDPSTGTLLYETRRGENFGTVHATGFRIGVLTYTKGSHSRVAGALPALDAEGSWPSSTLRSWMWQTWEAPRFHEYLKPAYNFLKATWGTMK